MTEPAAGLAALLRSRRFWLVLLLWLQCCLAGPRLNEPLGDGRLHYNFDNAKFLRHALHSNYAPPGRWDARLLAGTAIWEFAGDGSVTGLKFYARHPVLLPALFRLCVMACGPGWWVPRTFMLLHLLATLALGGAWLKGVAIVESLMALRHAPLWLRGIVHGWLLLVCGGLLISFA